MISLALRFSLHKGLQQVERSPIQPEAMTPRLLQKYVVLFVATDIVANSSFNFATQYFRYAETIQKIKLKIKLWPSIHSRAMLVNLRN